MKKTKKVFAMLVAGVMMFSLVACGSTKIDLEKTQQEDFGEFSFAVPTDLTVSETSTGLSITFPGKSSDETSIEIMKQSGTGVEVTETFVETILQTLIAALSSEMDSVEFTDIASADLNGISSFSTEGTMQETNESSNQLKMKIVVLLGDDSIELCMVGSLAKEYDDRVVVFDSIMNSVSKIAE